MSRNRKLLSELTESDIHEESLALKPAVYSKTKRLCEVIVRIKLYPAQIPAGAMREPTVTAPDGEAVFDPHQHAIKNAIEFVLNDDSNTAVGTLSEFAKHFPNVRYFFIYPLLGNGLLMVEKINGAFEVTDGFGEGAEI